MTIRYPDPTDFAAAERLNDMAFEFSERLRLAQHVRYAMEDPSNPAMTWADAWQRAKTHCTPSAEVEDHVEATAYRLSARNRRRSDYQLAKSTISTLKREHTQALKGVSPTPDVSDEERAVYDAAKEGA